jgi:putative tryptophan/tyrosine transport system substrate-binding protein
VSCLLLTQSGHEQLRIAGVLSSANDQLDRLPRLVADLISRQVTVIVGNTNAALAAKAATATVPIVFVSGSDPVRDGFVTSLNRPGGNVTGVTFLAGQLGAKRLELLRELVPKAKTIAMLANPNSPETVAERQDVQAAARAISQQLIILDVNGDQEIETAFTTFAQRGTGALFCGAGAFFNSRRDRVVALAARYALPTIYVLREFVSAGFNELWHQYNRGLSPSRHLCRANSQRRKAYRLASRTVHQI